MTPLERRELLEDVIAHVLAGIITLGFFSIVMVALLGFVDIKDPAVTAFVGTALGYAAGKLDPVMTRYYRALMNPSDNS